MNKCCDIDVEEIRLASVERPEAHGAPLDLEEYFRRLVKGAIAEISSSEALREPRPLLYKSLDEAFDNSVDLIFVEAEYLDYLCHVFAIGGNGKKFALIPPLATGSYKFHNIMTGGDDQWVEVRGTEMYTQVEWSLFTDELSAIAEALEERLNGDLERFIGFLGDNNKLEPICEGGKIGLVRTLGLREESSESYPSVSVIRSCDSLTVHVESRAARCVNAAVWECGETNDCGMDLGLPSFNVEDGHMLKIVEFPKSYECRLFIWDSQHNGHTDLVDMMVIDEQGDEKSIKVLEAEAKRNPFPSSYGEGLGGVYYVPLKELTRRIARGTSLKGKDLSISGNAKDDYPFRNGSPRFPIGTLHRDDKIGVYRADRSYYVDNASIQSNPDRPGGAIDAKLIEEIPPGQERYTLLPKDGDVLLMPRNGRNVARYVAVGPTLVSNNLFIVWPDSEKVDPEYLTIAMNSSFVTSQFDSEKKALGKSDLEKLLIPMADKDAMTAVVSRKWEISEEIDELRMQLNMLRWEDPLTQLRRTAGDSGRNDCKRDELQ